MRKQIHLKRDFNGSYFVNAHMEYYNKYFHPTSLSRINLIPGAGFFPTWEEMNQRSKIETLLIDVN